jgi:hypothetical protein
MTEQCTLSRKLKFVHRTLTTRVQQFASVIAAAIHARLPLLDQRSIDGTGRKPGKCSIDRGGGRVPFGHVCRLVSIGNLRGRSRAGQAARHETTIRNANDIRGGDSNEP